MSNTFKSVVIFNKTSRGQMQQWQVIVNDDMLHTEEGLVGGVISVNVANKIAPKNTGKKNATTGHEQAVKDAKAKFEKKLKGGYSADPTLAGVLEFHDPQLASPMKDCIKYMVYDDGMMVAQHKLNGLSALASVKFGLHSRTGEKFYMKTCPHIMAALQPMFDAHPDIVIQGELYNDNYKTRLNDMNSIVSDKADRELTPEHFKLAEDVVQFWIYDYFNFAGTDVDSSYNLRRKLFESELQKHCPKFGTQLKLVETVNIKDEDQLNAYYSDYVSIGGEGLIIRFENNGYEVGKRSRKLIKMKPVDDAEFMIVGMNDAKGIWQNKCKTIDLVDVDGVVKEGIRFRATFKGGKDLAQICWDNKEKWIGRKVSISYNGLTGKGDGCPNFAQFDYSNAVKIDK